MYACIHSQQAETNPKENKILDHKIYSEDSSSDEDDNKKKNSDERRKRKTSHNNVCTHACMYV